MPVELGNKKVNYYTCFHPERILGLDVDDATVPELVQSSLARDQDSTTPGDTMTLSLSLQELPDIYFLSPTPPC